MAWLPDDWKKMIISIERLHQDEDKEKLTPVGTAFLIDDKGLNVLVTCKHIIQGADLEKLFLSFITPNSEIHKLPLNQISMGIKHVKWVFDKRPDIDIAVIPCPMKADHWDTKKLSMKNFTSFDQIFEGDEIFFLGFPLGLESLGTGHPLVRQGIVAFKYENGIFLIDAQVYPGNSGSPVFLKPSIIDFDSKGNAIIGKYRPPNLIGIISSYIPYIEPCVSSQTNRARITFEENSGLAKVYSLDLITNIFQSKEYLKMRSELESITKRDNKSK